MLEPWSVMVGGLVLSVVLLGVVSPVAAQVASGLVVPQQISPLPPLPASSARPPESVPGQTPVADLLPSAVGPQVVASAAMPGAAPPLFVYPLPEPAVEVDAYGWRWSDSRQAWRMHAGHDLIAPEGTAALAMAAGQVVLVEEIDGYGLTVLLDHGGGWQSLYAHLLDASVRLGNRLPVGAPIGRVGQSGRATTAHLHVEVRQRLLPGQAEGQGVVAVDPAPLLAGALQRRHLQQAQSLSLASP